MSALGDYLSKVEAAITGYKEEKKVATIELKQPEPVKEVKKEVKKPLVLNSEVTAGCKVMRTALDTTGYSSFVSDAQIENIVTQILVAAAKVRK